MLLGIMGWVALGLLAGFIASKIINLHGDDPNIGICFAGGGALFGGWMFSLFSGNEVSYFNLHSIMVAAIGAGLTLVVWHMMRKHSLSRYR